MRLIRTARLVRKQQHGAVQCEIELCQLPGSPDRFLVNMRQGRSAEEWRFSTRTPTSVPLEAAEARFAEALSERQSQGFTDAASAQLMAPLAQVLVEPESLALAAGDEALLERLVAEHWKRLNAQQRSRTLWRVGERRLQSAVPAMLELIGTGSPMQDYCTAWAIGRCRDPGAASAMQELASRGATDAVRRVALYAWLELIDRPRLEGHAQSIVGDWPARLRAAWANEDEAALTCLPSHAGPVSKLSLSDWLEQLHQVALVYPLARRVLLAHLQHLPLRPGVFGAVRHIFKFAELRADAELFGLLLHRFETTPSTSPKGKVISVNGRHVSYTEEAARPDSSVAYSVRTRDYLRRRGWRTLRRLGADNDPAYVTFAVGALLAMHDVGAFPSPGARSTDRYGHWMLFNRMLRARGAWRSNRSGTRWYQDGPILPGAEREEAFPALWDARPDALLCLLQHSHCAGVHEFAARALIDNTAYCAELPPDVLRTLLRSIYQASARFAFQLCRQRFEPGLPGREWLLSLLHATVPEATQYVRDCLSRDPGRYSEDALLVATIACAPDESVRLHGRMLCQCTIAFPGQAPKIVQLLLDWLDNCCDLDNAEVVVPAIAPDLQWLLAHPLLSAAVEAPHARLLDLLAHRLACVRVLACEWLLQHREPVAAIPASTLASLLRDGNATVRRAGVRLFGALPDSVLASQPLLFAAFCTDADPGVRRATDTPLRRIASADAAFCAALLPALLDGLFRRESAEGVHDDLLEWVLGPLKIASGQLDRASVLRLLSARSKGAQQLGMALLPSFRAEQFGVDEWATLGRNDNVAVRQWAFAAFRADPARVRSHLAQALRLLDSRWQDSKEFACGFFRAECTQQDWTPDLVVSLCDHLDPAIQRFGCAMLTAHCHADDVAGYMLQLSQHPSPNMQLFVSAWLESASAGDLSQLERLEPYFLSVLSQVNRGRVAKNRVLTFLREQAASCEPIAAFVARLFVRQVVTVAIADKAHYIEDLRAIQARFPGLPATLTIQAPRALGSA